MLKRVQIWCLSKVRTVRLAKKVIFGIFLSFSLKAHNYYPAYHIGPDGFYFNVPALRSSLHENVL